MSTTWRNDKSSAVILGDSLSTGYGCAHPYNHWSRRMEWSFPTTAIHQLARSGSCAEDLIAGGRWYAEWGTHVMAQVQQVQPRLLVVALGANNYGYFSMPVEQYRLGLDRLAARLRVLSPDSTILWVHTNGFRGHTAALWVSYGVAMRELAELDDNADYLDLAAILPWGGGDNAGLYLGDQTHLNDAGHVAMAAALMTKLDYV